MSPSRSDVIRTRDLYVPNVALYQAEPHSDKRTGHLTKDIRRPCQGTTDRGLEPLLTESESAVLPLHQSAMCFQRTCYIIPSFSKKATPFFIFFNFFSFFSIFFLDLKTTARTPHTRTSYSLRMSGVRISTGHSSILSDPNAMTSQPTNFLSLDPLYSLNCCYGILIRTKCSQSEVSFSAWTES